MSKILKNPLNNGSVLSHFYKAGVNHVLKLTEKFDLLMHFLGVTAEDCIDREKFLSKIFDEMASDRVPQMS